MEAGSWAAALMAVGVIAVVLPSVAQSGPDNPETNLLHMLSITGDTDSDGLLDVEGKFFNASTNVFDSDGNGLPDGYDAAWRLWQQIGALPTASQTNAPYIIENLAKGLVRCDVCGEIVNMGYLHVINPVEKTEVFVPILAMHFMEHGGLRYPVTIHTLMVAPIRASRISAFGITRFTIPGDKGARTVLKRQGHRAAMTSCPFRAGTAIPLALYSPGLFPLCRWTRRRPAQRADPARYST